MSLNVFACGHLTSPKLHFVHPTTNARSSRPSGRSPLGPEAEDLLLTSEFKLGERFLQERNGAVPGQVGGREAVNLWPHFIHERVLFVVAIHLKL